MYEPQDGQHLFANAFNSLLRGLEGVYVINGCAISINSGSLGSTDTLSLASGAIDADQRTSTSVSSQNVGISSSSSDGPRFDLVSIDSTGSPVVTEGNVDTSSNPTPAVPAIPSGNVPITAVYVPEGASSISSSELYDLRTIQNVGMIDYVQTSEPPYDGERTWINPDTGILYAAYDDGSGGAWHPVPPAQVLDEATAFDGGDGENVTLNDTEVSGGSIQLPTTSATFSRTADDGSFGNTDGGYVVNPNKSLSAFTATISANTTGTSTAAIIRDSDGTELNSKDVSNLAAGDTFTISADMSSGTRYRLLLQNLTDIGYYSSANYPQSNSDFDIPEGWIDGSTTQYYPALNDVSASPPDTGDAVVSWSAPADIHSWDLATFQRTLDGETVTIDVEDGNGNVLFSDIGRNFDISTVSTSKNVRFRATLSRANSANNPTLDYLGRRYVR